MAGRDEIEDMLLIAHNNGRLSDIQLLCLVNEHKEMISLNQIFRTNYILHLTGIIMTKIHARMKCALKRLIFYASNAVYKSQTK